jgi:glutathione S-transferase
MKLYGHPGSICTNRVLFALAEKSVEPEVVVVDLAKGEHKLPAHLARHPFGMLPALEDGDVSLYESRAIIRYVDDKLPGTRLPPRNRASRAAMEQWISVEQSYASPFPSMSDSASSRVMAATL